MRPFTMQAPIRVAMIICIVFVSFHHAGATDGDAAFWPNAAETAPESSLGASATLPLLASHFQDHMVLQRGGNGAVVWGFAPVGTKVSVTFANAPYAAIADSTGTWRVRLAPLAAGGPYTLEVTAGSTSAKAEDVLMGDVYIVGGQSNAQFTVDSAFNSSAEVAAAGNFPTIRVFTVGQGTQSSTPLPNLVTIEQAWAVASPASVGVGNWSAISAIGWFFARDLTVALDASVPIGILSDNWGGTQIQLWTSAKALLKCTNATGSTLYNAMINPLMVGPLALTGVVWYQGEADANLPTYYECAFPNMIEDWRTGFVSPSLWFIGVQLAPYIVSAPGYGPLRQSQLSIFELGNTALVTAMDLGDALSPFGSVHPRAKQPVGARLAANALAQVYGKDVPHLSPRFLNATGSVDGEFITVSVTFVEESVVDGLQLVPGASCPVSEGVPASQCSGFVLELSGPSGTLLVNATATISDGGKAVTLSAQAPTAGYVPVTTQSCYNSWPIATLYTRAGFPAFPWNAPVYPSA